MSLFGDRLRALRHEKSLTQAELSKIIGVSKSSINMYERGDREPGFEKLEAFADYFNVDIDYLMGRSSLKEPLAIEMNLDCDGNSEEVQLVFQRLGEKALAGDLTAKDMDIFIKEFGNSIDDKRIEIYRQLISGIIAVAEKCGLTSDDIKISKI